MMRMITREHVQNDNIVTGQLQCMKVKPLDLCRRAIVLKLRPSPMRWETITTSTNTHPAHYVSEPVSLERYYGDIHSIKGRMKDWKGKKAQK